MEAGTDPTQVSAYADEIARVEAIRDETVAELELFSGSKLGDIGADGFKFDIMVEDNQWRTPDGLAAGLDGWVGLHYNWVRLNTGADLTVGGHAEGEFFLTFQVDEGESQFFVRGTFEVPVIKADRWVTENVMAEKLAEDGTTLCQ